MLLNPHFLTEERDVKLGLNNIIILFIFSVCLLTSFRVGASECRKIYQQDSKSSGVTVKENSCLQTDLSTGSVVELAPKGRLWLKSAPSEYVKSRFQLICQNRSGDSLQLAFSDMLSPWLSVSALGNCQSGWVNNKLSCKATDGKQQGLYCVLSALNKSINIKSTRPERTTSVKMREIKKIRSSSGKVINFDQKRLDFIKSELQLCKALNQVAGKINMQWTVNMDGQANVIERGSIENDALFACFEAVVTTFPYPEFSKKMTFKSTF